MEALKEGFAKLGSDFERFVNGRFGIADTVEHNLLVEDGVTIDVPENDPEEVSFWIKEYPRKPELVLKSFSGDCAEKAFAVNLTAKEAGLEAVAVSSSNWALQCQHTGSALKMPKRKDGIFFFSDLGVNPAGVGFDSKDFFMSWKEKETCQLRYDFRAPLQQQLLNMVNIDGTPYLCFLTFHTPDRLPEELRGDLVLAVDIKPGIGPKRQLLSNLIIVDDLPALMKRTDHKKVMTDPDDCLRLLKDIVREGLIREYAFAFEQDKESMKKLRTVRELPDFETNYIGTLMASIPPVNQLLANIAKFRISRSVRLRSTKQPIRMVVA